MAELLILVLVVAFVYGFVSELLAKLFGRS